MFGDATEPLHHRVITVFFKSWVCRLQCISIIGDIIYSVIVQGLDVCPDFISLCRPFGWFVVGILTIFISDDMIERSFGFITASIFPATNVI